VLGEDLVLFRSERGELGLIGDRCLHRAVELQYGIPDPDGLRCPYHGWLYGTDGRCLDQPLEDPASALKDRLRLPAYPVQELGGLIFAYLGPQPAPLLPRWDLFVWPNAIRQIAVNVLNCNWLQCHENTGDPTHSVWLHGHLFKHVLDRMGKLDDRAGSESHTLHSRIRLANGIKELYARATPYGMEKGVVYSKELGADEDKTTRHSTVIFPFYTQTGAAGLPRSEFQIRVPMDDTHTYHICYQVYSAPDEIDVPAQPYVPYYEPPLRDEAGRPILDFVFAQDALAWQAQGELTDRTKEHLARTDVPITFLRHQLEEQIRVVEAGDDPMNVFQDRSQMGDMLHGADRTSDSWTRPIGSGRVSSATFRAQYHKGFGMDDADRYGPALPLVQDLHRRIEEYQIRAAERTTA